MVGEQVHAGRRRELEFATTSVKDDPEGNLVTATSMILVITYGDGKK